jgi:hypothetical protein
MQLEENPYRDNRQHSGSGFGKMRNSSDLKRKREGDRMLLGASKLPSIHSARESHLKLRASQGNLRKSMKKIDSMMSLFAIIPDMKINLL